MDYRVLYFFPFGLSAGLIFITALFTFRRVNARGGWYLACACLAATIWAASEGMLYIGLDIEINVLITKLQYLGVVSLPPLFLLFALSVFGFESWINNLTRLLLFLIASTIVLLVWTNPLHKLFFTEFYTIQTGPFPMLGLKHGPFWWVVLLYHYSLFAVLSIVLLHQMVTSSSYHRSQAGVVLVAAAFVWISNAVYVSGNSPVPNMDISPIAFVLVAGAMAWGFFRYGLLDILPIAKTEIFRGLGDAILILDEKNRVIDMNPAAESIFNISVNDSVGRAAQQVFGDYPQLYNLTDEMKPTEDCMFIEGHERIYDINVSVIKDRKGAVLGRGIILRNITVRKQTEDALTQREAILNATGRMAKVGGWELDLDSLQVRWTAETARIHEVPLDYAPPLDEAIRFYPPEERPGLEEAVNRAIEHGEPYDREMRFITATGKQLWVHTVSNPQVVNGKTVKLSGTFQDITERKQAEIRLKRNERLLNATQQLAKIGGWEIDLEKQVIFWTDEVYRIHDLQPDEFTSIANTKVDLIPDHKTDELTSIDQAMKLSLECYGPEDRHVMMDAFKKCKEEGQAYDLEFPFTTTKGRRTWVRSIASPIMKDGKVIKVVGNLMDITDRKQAEEAIRKSESMHSKMVANIGDVIVIIDQHGINRYKSPNVEKLFGWKTEEVVGASTWDNIHPEDLESTKKFFGALVHKPNAVGTMECRYKCKDSSYRWIQFTGSNLLHDPDIRGILGNYHDITERKQTEQSLLESKFRFKALHNASFGGIAIHDKGIILECNQGLSEMMGYPVAELIGMDGLQLIAEKSRKAVMHNIVTGYEKPYEATGLRKNGEEFPIRLEARNVPYKGKNVRTVEFRDITEHKELAGRIQQAQKMESIGTLAGGIAHDFNNILFPIIICTEMLMEDIPADSPLRNNLNTVFKGALRAKDLVKQILAFARQDLSEIKLMRMQSVLKEALKLIRSTIPTSIEIEQYINNDCGPIKANPTQIHQIVVNLATNAYHAMEDTGGKLKINFKEIELCKKDLPDPDMEPGPYACLTVADTGVGIDKEIKNKIYDPFFTTKGQGKGTGMGLSVIHGIVKSAGGTIQLYSNPGQETEFHVYLPVVRSAFEPQEPYTKKVVQRGTERILLVDDEDAIVLMEKQMLERIGYSVVSFTSSVDALEAFRADPDKFDLVITDMAMPKISGDKLASELTKIRSDIPILLCTGFSEKIPEKMAKSMGNKGLVMKPIVTKDLSARIREVLDLKPAPK